MTITEKDLKYVLERLNKMTDHVNAPYSKNEDGTWSTNVGSYLIGAAYGGYQLQQVVNSGGVQCITVGFITKRELYSQMHAFIAGIDAATAMREGGLP
jgi:hypothetical protein